MKKLLSIFSIGAILGLGVLFIAPPEKAEAIRRVGALNTYTPTITNTPTNTPTGSPTPTPTFTHTPTHTATHTNTPGTANMAARQVTNYDTVVQMYNALLGVVPTATFAVIKTPVPGF